MDSGVGGLSIWKEIIRLLPFENTIYFADSKNLPYGSKPLDEIRKFSFRIVRFLLEQKCKLIIVACNSITTTIINELRENFCVPFVGIEPAIKVAASHTKTNNIGVLATAATMNGKLYNTTKLKIPEEINIHFQVGYGLVELIEQAKLDNSKTISYCREYINYFLDNNVDTVVLGCTHYPFLINKFEEISGHKIHFIDPAIPVVKQIERVLMYHGFQNNSNSIGSHSVYSSGTSFAIKALLPDLDYSKIKIVYPKSLD
jgi:glutamate racemase